MASNRLQRVRESILPWIVPVSLLVIWEIAVRAVWISNRFLPAPSAVLVAAVQLTRNGVLPRHMLVSTVRALTGLAIGGGLGFVLGLSTGLVPAAERALDSSIQMLRNIPNLALVPLVILWFGIEESAKLVLVGLGVFFPLYVNTFHGVRTVDPGLIEMARMYHLGPVDLMRKVLLPGALPSILVGLRIALGTMWLTLIVAETISAKAGLGYMATNAREFMQTDVVVLAILIYALLGKLADLLVRLLERRLLCWHPSYQPRSQTVAVAAQS